MNIFDSLYNVIESFGTGRGRRSEHVSDAMAKSLSIDDIVRMQNDNTRNKITDRRMNDSEPMIDPQRFASAFRRMRDAEPGAVTDRDSHADSFGPRADSHVARRNRIEDMARRRREAAERRQRVKDDDDNLGVYSLGQTAAERHADTPTTDFREPVNADIVEQTETDNTATADDVRLLDLLLSNFRDLGQKGFLADVCPTTTQCVRTLTAAKQFPVDVDAILGGVGSTDPRAQGKFCEHMLDYRQMCRDCGISSLFMAGLEASADDYMAIRDLFFPRYADDETVVEEVAEEALLDEDEEVENLEDIENILQQIISEAQISDAAKHRVHDNIVRRHVNNLMRAVRDDDNLKEAARASSVLTDLEEYLKGEITEEVLEEVGERYDLQSVEDIEAEEDADFDMGDIDGMDDFGADDFGSDDLDMGGNGGFGVEGGNDADFSDFDDLDSFSDFDADAEGDTLGEEQGGPGTIDFDAEEGLDEGLGGADADAGAAAEANISVDQVAELALALAKVLKDKTAADSVESDSVRQIVRGVRTLTQPIGDSAQTFIPLSKEEYSRADKISNLIEATYQTVQPVDGAKPPIREAEACGGVVLANKSTAPRVMVPRPSTTSEMLAEAIQSGDFVRLHQMCVPMEDVEAMAATTNTLCALDEGFYKANPLSEGWEFDEPNPWVSGKAMPTAGTIYPEWYPIQDSTVPLSIKGVPYKVKGRME